MVLKDFSKNIKNVLRMKKISVLTPCYNEEENIQETYLVIKHQFEMLKGNYEYEHIFIDNASTDTTVSILKEIAKVDKNVKVIVNARNVGFLRSSFYGLLQAYGDAVIFIEADLQTPPSVIPEFIAKWETGALIVAGVKEQSKENFVMFRIRKLFYSILGRMSETPLINNFLGVGLYDQTFINLLRKIDDPCPYFRGLVSELGSNIAKVNYVQEVRKKGKTSFSFYRLYDVAMLGFVNYTKLPLRLASFIGLFVAFICLVLAGYTFIYKIINWNSFEVGQAAISVGIFFLGAVQLIFLGIIGEYISAIYLQIRKRPLVIEKERVNFDKC